MKIAFITGSLPPDTCGIGDYTAMLMQALGDQGVATEALYDRNWNLGNTSSLMRRLRSLDYDLAHLQYPTVGFGWHLTPQVMSMLVRPVVTIHEISLAHLLRKLSLYPFALRARHLVFTTDGERDYARRCAPWIDSTSSVIPIGNNIPVGRGYEERTGNEIVYFGLLRPNKGLENVLNLASLIKQRQLPYRIRLIGKPFPPGSDYFKTILRRCSDLPVELSIDQDDEKVMALLSHAAVGYMPFPDGASGRRGSLLALLANGIATITTRGPQTPQALDDCVVFADSPEQTLLQVERLCTDRAFRETLSGKARTYAEQHSWKAIARLHIDLYERLLQEDSRLSESRR